jgi:hypothetical protein
MEIDKRLATNGVPSSLIRTLYGIDWNLRSMQISFQSYFKLKLNYLGKCYVTDYSNASSTGMFDPFMVGIYCVFMKEVHACM